MLQVHFACLSIAMTYGQVVQSPISANPVVNCGQQNTMRGRLPRLAPIGSRTGVRRIRSNCNAPIRQTKRGFSQRKHWLVNQNQIHLADVGKKPREVGLAHESSLSHPRFYESWVLVEFNVTSFFFFFSFSGSPLLAKRAYLLMIDITANVIIALRSEWSLSRIF